MQANRGEMSGNKDCLNDHQTQQERLKTMTPAPADKVKAVSAEIMIESLIKESFKKSNPVSVPVKKTDNFCATLPLWLQCESTAVPSLYKQLWSLVALNTELAHTQKVSQLLLTSGLHVDILGFIWNLANKAIPGQLTKQEFYIVLALVGLAQTGCTFNSLNVLKHVSVPSIPILQTVPQTSVSQNSDVPFFHSAQQSPNVTTQKLASEKTERNHTSQTDSECHTKQNTLSLDRHATFYLASHSTSCGNNDISITTSTINKQDVRTNKEKNSSKNSTFPCIGSSPTLELDDDFSEFQSVPVKINEVAENIISSDSGTADDFTDFQSANVENLDSLNKAVVEQGREIPKILLPKGFSEKFTSPKSNIIKISPESERRLKGLSATESLSSLPESKISSSNTVSTSISVLGGSTRANNSFVLGSKADKERCYKHQKFKASPGSSVNLEEVMFGVAPVFVENLMPKNHSKNSSKCSSFALKETKIANDILNNSIKIEDGNICNFSAELSKESTRQIEIPMLGTFNETVLPTQRKFTSCLDDLISVQEDKYSALRGINLEQNQEISNVDEKNDEFGDFLSANVFSSASVRTDFSSDSASSPTFEKPENENWGDWSFNLKSKAELNISDPEECAVVGEQKPKIVVKEEAQDLFDAFTTLSFTEKSECSKDMPTASPEKQEDEFAAFEIVNYSKGGNKDNVLLFYDQSDNSNLGSLTKSDKFHSQSNTDFLEFLSSEVKTPAEVTLSRQGSLPSLELKISAADETEQEVVWRKCLESCHNLIQEGFETFNNIRVKSVLDEVFSSSKTGHYLNCLFIVYQISKRIRQNFNGVPSLQEDLEKYWGRLQELCFEYNIKLVSCEEEVSEGASQCCICLKYIVCDLINQGMYSYHPSCANLWINFIEETLPFST